MPTREQRTPLKSSRANLRRAGAAPSFGETGTADAAPKAVAQALNTVPDEGGWAFRRPMDRARAVAAAKSPGSPDGKDVAGIPTIRARRGKSRRDASPIGWAVASNAPVPDPVSVSHTAPTAPRAHSTAVSVLTVSGKSRHRAMTAKSDSITGAGIGDGDVAVVRAHGAIENGDIAAALIDGGEAMPDTPPRRVAAVESEAANPTRGSRLLPSERVKTPTVPRDSSATTGKFPAAAGNPVKRNKSSEAIMRRHHSGNTRGEGARDGKLNRMRPVRGDVSGWIPARGVPPSRFGGARGFPKAFSQATNKPMTSRPGGDAVFNAGIVAEVRLGDASRPAVETANPPFFGGGGVPNIWHRRAPDTTSSAAGDLAHGFRKAYDVVQGMFAGVLEAAGTNKGDGKRDHHGAGGDQPREDAVRGASASEAGGADTGVEACAEAGSGAARRSVMTAARETAPSHWSGAVPRQEACMSHGTAARVSLRIVPRVARAIARAGALSGAMTIRWLPHPIADMGFGHGATPL